MKTIYNALLSKLSEVTALKWVDMDTGQLNTDERAAIAFPAALISIEIPTCKNITDKQQDCTARITVRLVFDNPGTRTNNKAPEAVRAESLKKFDTIADVYATLQGYETSDFNALTRVSQAVERSNKYFVYRIDFTCDFEDLTAE